jgi:hypothetical protein
VGGCGFCGAGRESIFFFYHLFEALVRIDLLDLVCDMMDLPIASSCDSKQIPESLRTKILLACLVFLHLSGNWER